MKRPAWFWALLGASVVVAALGVAAPVVWAPRGQIALLAGTAALSLCVSALSWTRYRGSKDPHALFLSAGFGLLGVQLLAYGVLWPLTHPGTILDFVGGPGPNPLPALAWQIAWVVAGGCFLLGVPWWDRRGRPPVRPVLVWSGGIAANAALETIAIPIASGLQDHAAWIRFAEGHPGRFGLGPAGWVLGLGGAALLLVAGYRETERPRAPHGWTAAVLVLAAALQVNTLAHPFQGMGYLTWVDGLQPIVPAIALAGLLVSQRADVSQMRRATDRAQEVMGGRAEIAAMIAHEVRGPISTIKGLAATTSQSYERLSDDERREFIRLIDQESGRLLDTVNQTSLALKVDAGTLRYEKRAEDLAGLVLDGAESANASDRVIDVDAAEGVRVVVDRRYLVEAIRQLVDNAAKFSPPEAPISVRLEADGGQAVIEVVDGGPGVPAARRETVFEKFVRWRPTGYEDRPGAGLGLFLCRGIARAHGGEVLLAEAPGGGTMARIRLPLEG